jgi:transposase-like protein
MAGKSKYKTYSPEFKEEAARLVVDTSRPIADVARELGISETSLGNWGVHLSKRCLISGCFGHAARLRRSMVSSS